MYANDTQGDCVIAALGHQQNSWTEYATGTEGGPTLAQVESVYKTLSPNDTGVDMLTSLKYISHYPLGESVIAAYVALDLRNHAQAKTAIDMFGSIFIGLSLPNAIVNSRNPLDIPWGCANARSNRRMGAQYKQRARNNLSWLPWTKISSRYRSMGCTDRNGMVSVRCVRR
jgi:hypothetical protein